MSSSDTEQIAVVGAGIIGVAVAFELQRRGKSVTLIDRSEPGLGASFGNMASIAVTEFMPASRLSVWAQMPKWLLDPEGPVRVRPSYLPRLTPWFVRFLEASRPSRVRKLEAAGAALCKRVYDDLLPLLETAGLSHMLTDEGCLSLYTDETEFKADREHIEVLERFGFPHEVLGGNELRELEPAITTKIGRAVLFPQNRSVRDPYNLVLLLAERFIGLGGRMETGEVVGFDRSDHALEAIRLKDGRRVVVSSAVLCAGAYTGRLSRLLGEHIPLETERGYHTHIMAPGISMRHSIIWPARAFMVTPTAGGIRVGGTVEMAGLDAPPDYRRAKVLVKRASEALPDLQPNAATEWMGHRPALPDTVPIIGPSARTRGLYYATGHGHLGLTYAATTARLIADLTTGKTPPIDLRPYRVDRF
ncbi:NAD(P)/FAD-dependent oxidoreductase [Mesorhizobium sp. B4-1-4]|uniref:NAD(P)/FAD-dependent oxidoreductase n=1 Tax=Mesorhizobium sp. B4-1-4 TaxID=2589888 RepID=UPI0011264D8A|nr:FAD-binding oxidoreductase [Mesorhizobium sp. B4-1-4]UCI34635.1 FAD-binding oxidoreductase [Mesorhizobium sp. B4-1-4]